MEQKKEQDHEMIQRELAMPIPGLRVTETVSDRAWQGSVRALSSRRAGAADAGGWGRGLRPRRTLSSFTLCLSRHSLSHNTSARKTNAFSLCKVIPVGAAGWVQSAPSPRSAPWVGGEGLRVLEASALFQPNLFAKERELESSD